MLPLKMSFPTSAASTGTLATPGFGRLRFVEGSFVPGSSGLYTSAKFFLGVSSGAGESAALSHVLAHLVREFKNLVSLWHRERGATSSITQMAMCYSYQRIIGMGEKVVPLILRQMQDE